MYRLITLRQILALLGAWQTLRFLLLRLRGARTCTVKLASRGAPLTIRFNNSDLVLLLGVFLHGDCRLSLQPPPALILDLGANVGLTARAFADQFPSARIVAVEPDAGTFQLCQQNTAAHPGTVCLNRIVGTHAGRGQILNPEAISMAKQFAALPDGTGDGIRVSTIDELLDEQSAPGPVLVKMDIEGSEIAIFQQAGAWLERVQAVLVEPHGGATPELIRTTLAQHDFSLQVVGEKILGLRAPWDYHSGGQAPRA